MDVAEDGKVAYALLAFSVLDKAVAKLYYRVFQAVRGYFARVEGVCNVVCSEEAGGCGCSSAHVPLRWAGVEVMCRGRLHGCFFHNFFSQS